jgi:hypothetical protein
MRNTYFFSWVYVAAGARPRRKEPPDCCAAAWNALLAHAFQRLRYHFAERCPNIAGDRDHRRSNTSRTRSSAAASTLASIRARRPPPRLILITPLRPPEARGCSLVVELETSVDASAIRIAAIHRRRIEPSRSKVWAVCFHNAALYRLYPTPSPMGSNHAQSRNCRRPAFTTVFVIAWSGG